MSADEKLERLREALHRASRWPAAVRDNIWADLAAALEDRQEPTAPKPEVYEGEAWACPVCLREMQRRAERGWLLTLPLCGHSPSQRVRYRIEVLK